MLLRDPKAAFLQETSLGHAPAVPTTWLGRLRAFLGSPRDPAPLAYRFMARNIERTFAHEEAGVCLPFSAPDGDAISTGAMLMLAYALRTELDARVLLLDARPVARDSTEGLTGRLGLASAPGFYEILREGFADNAHLVQPTSVEGVDCLPAGGPQGGASATLDRVRLRSLVETLAQSYDYVLVQVGSILGDTRNLVAVGELGRVVLVAHENRTMMKTLDECLKVLLDHGVGDVRTVVAG